MRAEVDEQRGGSTSMLRAVCLTINIEPRVSSAQEPGSFERASLGHQQVLGDIRVEGLRLSVNAVGGER